MSLRTSSKSSLFLIELIIVILFFSVAGAICVSLFAQSHLVSAQSAELTMAVTRCQNAAEVLRAVGDDPQQIEHLLGAIHCGDGEFTVSYDINGDLSPDGQYVLKLVFDESPSPGLHFATITMDDGVDKQPIYSLDTVYRN